MLIQLSDQYRIVSNPTGGFDLQEADIDAKTGLIRTRKETGAEAWKFKVFHPKLDRLLESYIMTCTPVVDDTLMGAYQICATIQAEWAKCKAVIDALTAERNAAVREMEAMRKKVTKKEGNG